MERSKWRSAAAKAGRIVIERLMRVALAWEMRAAVRMANRKIKRSRMGWRVRGSK